MDKENERKIWGNNYDFKMGQNYEFTLNNLTTSKMRRRDRWGIDENQPEDKYAAAERKVKRLKGFYTHLIVYLCVNIFIIFVNISDLSPGESYFKMENFFTAFFWGIGLLAHGLSVFGHLFFFGSDWEEKKIQEFMDKDKSNKWE